MRTISFVVIAAALAGCATDSNGGGDDAGGDDAPPFTSGVSTLSGRAEAGYVDGPRGTARFNNPVNVVYAPDGQVVVADFDNNKLRVVDGETGDTDTLIEQDNFQRPFGMVFAPNGTFYVSTDNNTTGGHDGRSGTIWKVDIATRTATPVIENIGRARGMVVLADGTIAFTDYQAHTVSLLDPATKQVSILAGSLGQAAFVDAQGPAARFNAPYGIVQRSDGKLVVADQFNNRLRLVGLDGSVSTLLGSAAGFADGGLGGAKLSMPQALAQTANGDIYITDLANYRVRKLSGDSLTTVVGSGEGGYLDSDDKLAAEVYGLEGLSLSADGTKMVIADGGRGESVPFNRVRSVKM